MSYEKAKEIERQKLPPLDLVRAAGWPDAVSVDATSITLSNGERAELQDGLKIGCLTTMDGVDHYGVFAYRKLLEVSR